MDLVDANGESSSPAKAEEQRTSISREGRAGTLRPFDSLMPERSSSPLRNSTSLLQRSNSSNQERLQWSTSPQPGHSSPTTRSRQSGASRAQGSPSSPTYEHLPRSHSPVPRSPRSFPPESALPESGRGSPKLRTSLSSSGLGLFSQAATLTKSATFLRRGRRRLWKKGGILFIILLLFWFMCDWWYLSQFQNSALQSVQSSAKLQGWQLGQSKRKSGVMYERLLSLAAHGLAENELKREPEDLWEEPLADTKAWMPCADQRPEGYLPPPELHKSTGYIMISANGGLNQQRVGACNAVAVARMLNATLVLPRFLFNSVWRDSSQFGDIYDESFFIDYLKADVRIVKELPDEMQSLDLEAIGSLLVAFMDDELVSENLEVNINRLMLKLVTDIDVPKEAKPSFYFTNILPLLLRTHVVHFEGFGNRLAFDPIPFDIQRLRCRCNFHALKFLPELQETASLIIQRLRDRSSRWGPFPDEFLFDENTLSAGAESVRRSPVRIPPKYLALHMRFEMDMAAYSLCDFGGGEAEKEELRAYRAIHFPFLAKMEDTGKLGGSSELQRELGHCPLMPEEAVLMLAALGFKRGTRIYLAGAQIYGSQSKMAALTNLFPNLVTKEGLLTEAELAPFRNHSSKSAVLDYLGCAASDAFAMTDSGSQLSSLVAGYRMYTGAGRSPTIRPNKKRLAGVFKENATIEWSQFEDRVRKTIKETKKIGVRPIARSTYRHPRCKECMCQHD